MGFQDQIKLNLDIFLSLPATVSFPCKLLDPFTMRWTGFRCDLSLLIFVLLSSNQIKHLSGDGLSDPLFLPLLIPLDGGGRSGTIPSSGPCV